MELRKYLGLFSLGFFALLIAEGVYAQVENTVPQVLSRYEFPLLGRNLVVGIFSLGHVIFPAVALGGPILAIIAEYMGLRKRQARYDRFGKTVIKFTAIVFSVGATFGVVMVVLFAALFPQFWITGVNLFTWPLVLEGILFFLEVITLYSYFYLWDRWTDRRGAHMSLGLGNIVFGTGTMVIINGVATAMLTPPPALVPLVQDLVGGAITHLPAITPALAWKVLYAGNPTFFPLTLHRFFANISFMGFFFAAVMAFYYLRSKESGEKEYYGWATNYALHFGLLPLFAMLIIGYDLVNALKEYEGTYGAALVELYKSLGGNLADQHLTHSIWETMYTPFSNVMMLRSELFTMLGFFLSILVVLTVYYFYQRLKDQEKTLSSLALGIAVVGLILMVVPIKEMLEDYAASLLLVLGGALAVVVYARNARSIDFTRPIASSAYVGIIALGFFVSYAIYIMGFVREMARQPWLIPGVMTVDDLAPNHAHSATGMDLSAFGLLAVAFVALVLFWAFAIAGLKLAHVPRIRSPAEEKTTPKSTATNGGEKQD